MLRLLARLFLKSRGWTLGGGPPPIDKYVLIGAPHTSTWDLFHMLALMMALKAKIRWMGKKSLFKGPGGWMLHALGGFAIDRSDAKGLVEQLVERFEKESVLCLAMSPEGTRSHRDYWKSGFYRIALAANVPVVFGYLDFGRKTGGFGPTLHLTGDVCADMDKIRAFYGDIKGHNLEKQGPVRLRMEEQEGE
jgi:1-acyl-sn-glycerol-3-phosphate acyltransferase